MTGLHAIALNDCFNAAEFRIDPHFQSSAFRRFLCFLPFIRVLTAHRQDGVIIRDYRAVRWQWGEADLAHFLVRRGQDGWESGCRGVGSGGGSVW